MKRLCIVCDGYWDQLQGGAEYQLLALADSLTDRGYAVHYIYVDRGTPIRPTPIKLEPVRLPAFAKRAFHPYQPLLYGPVIKALSRVQPDVIINRVGNALTGICAKFGRTNGIPVIWHIANITDLMPWHPRFDRTIALAAINRAMLNYGIRHVSHVVAQAEYQDVMLRERHGRQADLIVPNFHPDAREAVVKDRLPLVLWVANLKQKKQPELFIRLAAVLGKRVDAQFIMVGRAEGGKYQSRIEQMLQATANVRWLGELPIDGVNALLSRASLFVNTSTVEGFPNTFIQAWLRQVPVVSLSFDPDGVIASRDLGRVSGSFEQLCCDVHGLITHPHEREEMGNAARAYALAAHGEAAAVERYVRLIEGIRR